MVREEQRVENPYSGMYWRLLLRPPEAPNASVFHGCAAFHEGSITWRANGSVR